MICPSCRHDMIVVEYRGIELDYCTNCRGVWFDSGELELLAHTAGLKSPESLLKDISASQGSKSEHAERKCPVCNRLMRETPIGHPAIYIDVCRRGDGLWFDGGEVYQLLKQLVDKTKAGEGAEQRIVAFLGEVFKPEEEGHSNTGGGS
jgi:Zn-finger nucleic acid-binding protein